METLLVRIEVGRPCDLELIFELDRAARLEVGRRGVIEEAINSGACHLAWVGERVVGYLILEYHFFGQGFVSLVYVVEGWRGRGVGGALLRHAQRICRTGKLFTSTNASNRVMQGLLEKCGFVRSGVVENLDEGDDEWIYYFRNQ